MEKLPRGFRNNNPLNLRKSSAKWVGKILSTDPEFEQFSAMVYGVRAAIVNIFTHIRRDRRCLLSTTVSTEIIRWAPPSENNTAAYIQNVCTSSALRPDSILVVEDKNSICQLIWAMIYVENGTHLDFPIIRDAYEMAIASI